MTRQIKTQDAVTDTNNVGDVVCSQMVGGNVLSVDDICTQNHVGSQAGPEDGHGSMLQTDGEMSRSEGTQAGGPLLQSVGTSTKSTGTRTKDYSDDMVIITIT